MTWDYGDSNEIDSWMLKPIFVVEKRENGGLCAKGIGKPLYLHDFRFKHTKKIWPAQE